MALSARIAWMPYFYPRSPCGERHGVSTMDNGVTQISIHALLAESDETIPGTQTGTGKFLSTLSLRRATRYLMEIGTKLKNFYPRSPCGERRPTAGPCFAQKTFLSTLSLRRATALNIKQARAYIFLSTLSLRRATETLFILMMILSVFLSTLSLRRATAP